MGGGVYSTRIIDPLGVSIFLDVSMAKTHGVGQRDF